MKAAKNELSRLVKAALSGETIIITDRGKPLVRLVPENPKSLVEQRRKVYGSMRDVLNLKPGWDSPEAKAEVTAIFEDLL